MPVNNHSWRLIMYAALSTAQHISSFSPSFMISQRICKNSSLRFRAPRSYLGQNIHPPSTTIKPKHFSFHMLQKYNEPNKEQNCFMNTIKKWKTTKSGYDCVKDDSSELLPKTDNEIHIHSNLEDDNKIRQKTMDWIQNVVIGLKLCPFADKPVNHKSGEKFKIHVIRGTDASVIASMILNEMLRLLVQPGQTSVIVTPEFHPDEFHLFLDFVAFAEDTILYGKSTESLLINQELQIAPFHPKFQFEESTDVDDVTNFTNKSPYPMFHILREGDVTYAVDSLGGDSSQVWGRNKELLVKMEEYLGYDGVKRVMNGEIIDGLNEIVNEIDSKEKK